MFTVNSLIYRIKQRVSVLFWSRKLFFVLLKKDFFKIISFFNKNYKKKYLNFLGIFNKTNNLFVKKKKFHKFTFYLRECDLGMMKEVFLAKDYFLVKDFIPKEGDVVLDLGAGVGDYAVLSSLKVGKFGKVVSIEADRFTYELLAKNIKLNNLSNVTPLNTFIGRKKIDDITKKLKLSKLSLIKIDIEGYEYEALRGATYCLRKFKPKIIIEIHSKELRKKIIDLLRKFGYKLVYEKIKKEKGFYLSYFM
jgi:precorrin-6B methylase 2